MRAAFDSLAVNFSFQKTKLVEKVLEKIFTQIQMPQIVGPLKGFNNLNLSLNFASSSTFDNYEQLRNFGKVINKIETYLFTSIKGQYKEDVMFFLIFRSSFTILIQFSHLLEKFWRNSLRSCWRPFSKSQRRKIDQHQII